MATSAQFTAQPILETSLISTGNTFRDGTGTMSTVATGPDTTAGNGVGKGIFRTTIQSGQATTAGVIRFFISTDGGTTRRMLCEKIVPAVTPSTTVAAWRTEVAETVGLILPGGTGNVLYSSTNNGETFYIFCESGTL